MLMPEKFALRKQTPHNETKSTDRFSLVPLCTTLRKQPENPFLPLRAPGAAMSDVQTQTLLLCSVLFRPCPCQAVQPRAVSLGAQWLCRHGWCCAVQPNFKQESAAYQGQARGKSHWFHPAVVRSKGDQVSLCCATVPMKRHSMQPRK